MKKTISLLLSLLMVLSLTACVRVKTSTVAQAPAPAAATEAPAPAAAPTAAPQPTAAPAATKAPSPVATEAPAPVATAEPAPTEEPAPAPTEEPAPQGGPLDDASAMLEQVQSLHVDMTVSMDVEVVISIGDMDQRMPMDVRVLVAADTTRDPETTRMTVAYPGADDEQGLLLYTLREGEHTAVYISEDDGVTWEKQLDPENGQPAYSPYAVIALLHSALTGAEKTDAVQTNGAPAAVYSCTVSASCLNDLLTTTGADENLSGVLGDEVTGEILSQLTDIPVMVAVDEESGLPVQYTIDLTAALYGLMEAVLTSNAGGASLSDAGFSLNIPSVTIDILLSQFNSVTSIEVPEAILAAPAA